VGVKKKKEGRRKAFICPKVGGEGRSGNGPEREGVSSKGDNA